MLPASSELANCVTVASEDDRASIKEQSAMMAKLKKRRRPQEPTESDMQERPHQRRRLMPNSGSQGSTLFQALQNVGQLSGNSADCETTPADLNVESHLDVIEQLIEEQNMENNPGQAHALRIVGSHVHRVLVGPESPM